MEPRGKAFCISHSSWMLYLTLDQSSLYHLSLPRAPGSADWCSCLEPDLWTAHLFWEEMGWRGGGDEYETTMITVTVWKVCLASHDSYIAPEALPEDCTLTKWQVSSHHCHVLETPGVTPGCRRVMCQFSAVTAALEDLFHVVISFDCIPCPPPDLAH